MTGGRSEGPQVVPEDFALAFTSAVVVLAPYYAAAWWGGLNGDQAILVTWAWIFLFMCILTFTGEE